MAQFAVRVNSRDNSRKIQRIAHANGWTRKNGSQKIANTRSECIGFPASRRYYDAMQAFGFSSERYYRDRGVEILDADRDFAQIVSRLGGRLPTAKATPARKGFFKRVIGFFIS